MLKSILSAATYFSFFYRPYRLLVLPLALVLWHVSPLAFLLTLAAIISTITFILIHVGDF